MEKSESIIELSKSLSKVQSEMTSVKKNCINPFFKSKYANLTDVIKVLYEHLREYEISFSQYPISEEGKVGVETIVMHNSGEWMSGKLLLPCIKQDPQSYGSCITYARRYALQSIFGIPADDDDGNMANNNASIINNETSKTEKIINDVISISKNNATIKKCECGAEINGHYSKCYNCFIK